MLKLGIILSYTIIILCSCSKSTSLGIKTLREMDGDPKNGAIVSPEPTLADRSERFKHVNEAFFKCLAVVDVQSLENSYLSQCKCPGTHTHNLALPGNTRAKIVNRIINHITKAHSSKPIRLLSLGSGGCLQDLVIVAKLVTAGIRSIDITLVEPDKSFENAYQDFDFLLAKMQQIFGTNVTLSWEKYSSIQDVNNQFDVIYAIDYDDYIPYFHRYDESKNSSHKTIDFSSQAYVAIIDLIKAANLTKLCNNPLVIMSKGRNIISLTPETEKSLWKDLKPCSDLNKTLSAVSVLYCDTDISCLLIYLDHLINLRQPLLINQAVLHPADRESLSAFLDRLSIDHKYIEDNLLDQKLKELESNVVIKLSTTWFKSKENAIPEKANVNAVIAKDKDKNGSLHAAAEKGDVEQVKILLRRGADINEKDKRPVYFPTRPLHLASEEGHVEIVKVLLDNGANLNIWNAFEYAPLHLASAAGHFDIVELLLKHKAEVNSQGEANSAPLHLASAAGHFDIVKLLLKHKAEVNSKGAGGFTPLHLASEAKHFNIAELLLKHQAEVDNKSPGGLTPLHLAIAAGDVAIVKCLLTYNADVNCRTIFDTTSLHMAIDKEDSDIVKLLLEYKADPHCKTIEHKTPLELALRKDNKKIANLIKIAMEAF